MSIMVSFHADLEKERDKALCYCCAMGGRQIVGHRYLVQDGVPGRETG